MRYLLDTNIVSDLVRHPTGNVYDHIRQVGEEEVCTSIIVAAELRYDATKRGSRRLAERLDAILEVLTVMSFKSPADTVHGVLRNSLERAGQPIGGNDLLIAAQCISLGLTIVTANEREFGRISNLRLENWLATAH